MLEIFSYLKTRGERGESAIEKSYVEQLEHFANQYRRFGRGFRLLKSLGTFRQGPIDLLFLGVRFSSLILSTIPKYKVGVVAQGQRDLLWCLRHRVTPVPAWAWRAKLHEAYEAARGAGDAEELLETIVADIAAVLATLKPRALILENDSLFVERAFILAARRLGIQSVTIQDGIFQKAAPPHVLHGHFTDTMLVWGDFFKQMYMDKNILPEERVHVLGYPYPLEPQNGELKENLTVCFLGQPWESLDEALRGPKAAVTRNVIEACRAVDLPLVYRPHPLERRHGLPETPGLNVTDVGEELFKALAKYNIFFSINSTALVEAALRGRVAAQILEARFPSDDFEALGVCYSLENSADAIQKFLCEMKEKPVPFPLNSGYIDLTENPGARLHELLSTLPYDAKR